MSTHPTTEPKFCKDCAHFLEDAGKFPECTAPVPEHLDLVHGKYAAFCDRMREPNGPCGPEGKLFQPPPEREFVVAPDRPLIVYAPEGCGKTLAGRFLAQHFGKRDFIDGCPPDMAGDCPPSHLIVTNSPRVIGAVHLGEALIKAGQDLLQSQAQPATEAAPGS